MAVALVVAAAAAERVVVQLGPRSWYTASTPVIVLAALIGGPLVGVAAGVSTQIIRPESVWRRQAAEGGIAGAPGPRGRHRRAGAAARESADTIRAAAAAMAVAVLVNERRPVPDHARAPPRAPARAMAARPPGRPPRGRDRRAAAIGAPDGRAARAPSSWSITVFSLLTALFIAQRSRATTAAELVAEQANARRDQLTGAANRRAFEEAMAAEHSRVVRGGLPAGLFVVDLDRFKSVNDRFGHAVGDEVLIEVVRRLAEGLRPSDMVARWGGEEIAVLAPGVKGRRQLEQFAERIRGLVGELPSRRDDGAAGDGVRRRHAARRLDPAGCGVRPRRQRALRCQAHARRDGDHPAARLALRLETA